MKQRRSPALSVLNALRSNPLPSKLGWTLTVIASYADKETWEAFPSMPTIARVSGQSVKTVSRAVHDLEDLGAIGVSYGRHKAITYTVIREWVAKSSDTQSEDEVESSDSQSTSSDSQSKSSDSVTTNHSNNIPENILLSDTAAGAGPTQVLEYPIKGKNGSSTWPLMADQIDRWATDYQTSSGKVLAECRKARAWAEANPSKRKTATGMPKFLVNWLGGADLTESGDENAAMLREFDEASQ